MGHAKTQKFEPVYKLMSTRFIFADQLILDDLLTMPNIAETGTLWVDQSHLFNHVFPSYFGTTIWNSALALLLRNMLNGDKNTWNKCYRDAFLLIRSNNAQFE